MSSTEAPKRPLTVGVLGGMGPEATLDFFARVLAATPAERDQDHLRLLIDDNPQVPNRNEAVAGTGPSPAPVLASMARGLAASGAELLVMPCNAAHAFQDAILDTTEVPFLSIVEVTTEATLAEVPGARSVGVLAAAGCLDAGLYQGAFAARGVDALELGGSERERFMTLLYRIKRGDKGPELRAAMRELAGTLIARGAEAIVAGCTEVPLVLTRDALPVPLIDSTQALAEATVATALRRRPLPRRPEPAP